MNVMDAEPGMQDQFEAYWITLPQHALADDQRLGIFGHDYPMLSMTPVILHEGDDTDDEDEQFHGKFSTYQPWLPNNWEEGRWREFGERFGLRKS